MFTTAGANRTPTRTSRRAAAPRPSSVRESKPSTPADGDGQYARSTTPAHRASPAPSSLAGTARSRARGSIAPSSRRQLRDDDSRATPGQAPTASASTSLEVGAVLKHNNFTAVTVLSRYPREVTKALNTADPYIDAVSGHIDVQTGYAVLVTAQRVYVWSIADRNASAASCYAFATPQSGKSRVHALAHVALVPRSAGRDPGLALVSVDGQVRFWDTLSASLVEGDVRMDEFGPGSASSALSSRSQHTEIALGANESVVGIKRCDASLFVVATSQSRLFRMAVFSSGGKMQVSVSPFYQSKGLFGRFFGGSTGSLYSAGSEGVVSMVACPSVPERGCRDIYSIGQRVIQKWRLMDGGGERLLVEQDVGRSVAALLTQDSAIADDNQAVAAADAVGLAFVDGALRGDGTLALLYSYAQQANEPMSYGIAICSSPDTASSAFAVLDNVKLQYRSLRDPRPYSSPHLMMPNGGPAVFVAFADNLIITSCDSEDSDADDVEQSRKTHFEERIPLRDNARNRFLGFGCEGAEYVSNNPSVAALSCLSAQSGSLLVEFSLTAAQDYVQRLSVPSERQAALTDRLQSHLEQAVFFNADDGSSSHSNANPLSFAISQDQARQAEVALAAERISQSILTSQSAYLEASVDVRQNLVDRLSHAVTLIKTIRQNDLLNVVQKGSRHHLCSDAELLAAGAELWQHQSQLMDSFLASGGVASTPLADAIEDTMAGLGLGFAAGSSSNQDMVRRFFGMYLTLVVAIFEHLHAQLRAVQSANVGVRSERIVELNRIAIAAFQAAHRFRSNSAASLYGLDGATPATRYEAWTSKVSSLQLLEALAYATEALLKDRKRELGGIVDSMRSGTGFDMDETGMRDAAQDVTRYEQQLQAELKAQMCELARYTLSSYEERLVFLGSSGDDGDGATGRTNESIEQERRACLGQYRSARPKLIHSLVSLVGRADRAFTLAEKHSDWRTLVELCLDPATGDPAPQIQHYLIQEQRRTAKENEASTGGFAFELYQYWLETGKSKALLEHGASNGGEWSHLVRNFLHKGDAEDATLVAKVSWLHDVSMGHFQSASATLLTQAGLDSTQTGVVQSLRTKNLMLSLGKLNYVAELDEDAIATAHEQHRIELIDDQLDLVAVHHKLIESFHNIVAEYGEASLQRRHRRQQQQRGKHASDSEDIHLQTEVVVEHLCARLTQAGQQAFVRHFGRLTASLLEGKVVPTEDLVDLLTLQDPLRSQVSANGMQRTSTDQSPEDVDSFYTALQVLVRVKEAQSLPSGRFDECLKAVWRRSLLADDWSSLVDTRDMSDEQMQARLQNTRWYRLTKACWDDPDSLDDDDEMGEGNGASSTGGLRGLLLPDDLSVLHEGEPQSAVVNARFQAGLGSRHGANEEGDGIGGSAKGSASLPAPQLSLFLDDLQLEVDGVRQLLEGEDGDAEAATAVWIREARRRACADIADV